MRLGFSGAKATLTTFGYFVGALPRYYLSPEEQGVDSLLKHGRFFLEGNSEIGDMTISDGGASAKV